ncbi:cation transporter [Colwellia ponticola]|uniref:Cation transporter n=1 Tax=Colwellia ponticola TaxID=2304625 RepID=A0A8H2PKS4_9GAMM|nr:cation transporter [Colwellia ponticola]TMM42400.1 cation transporter [Colwellia ponticola]
MTNIKHRVGVNELNLVSRHLKLDHITDDNKSALLAEIDLIHGIDTVSYNDKEQVFSVAYDATHTNLEEIEQIITRYGAYIADGWWNHFKENYYKFVDQNIKDNAEHVSSCCHKPPTGLHKK